MSETRLIADIVIGIRHRKDVGDIAGLAASIRDVGPLHPIVVRRDDRVLTACERRIAACTSLGWTEILVREADLAEMIRGELARRGEETQAATGDAA